MLVPRKRDLDGWYFPSQESCEVGQFVAPLSVSWKNVVASRTSTGTDISGAMKVFFADVEVFGSVRFHFISS